MRPRTDSGRQAAPVIETMGRSVPAWSPRATSKVNVTSTITDKVTGIDAPPIPVPEFARRVTALEQAEARRKGKRTGGIGWQALASRRGNP